MSKWRDMGGTSRRSAFPLFSLRGQTFLSCPTEERSLRRNALFWLVLSQNPRMLGWQKESSTLSFPFCGRRTPNTDTWTPLQETPNTDTYTPERWEFEYIRSRETIVGGGGGHRHRGESTVEKSDARSRTFTTKKYKKNTTTTTTVSTNTTTNTRFPYARPREQSLEKFPVWTP